MSYFTEVFEETMDLLEGKFADMEAKLTDMTQKSNNKNDDDEFGLSLNDNKNIQKAKKEMIKKIGRMPALKV